MAKEKRSFWDRLFGPYRLKRDEKLEGVGTVADEAE